MIAVGYQTLYRATIFHTPRNPFLQAGALEQFEDGALLVEAGKVLACGAYEDVREQYPKAVEQDWRGGFLLPGFIDTHVHFPQLRILGGLGRELLDWLEQVALPEEARMAETEYARETAKLFVQQLAAHGTTTALVFGAHFEEATANLFRAAAETGVRVVSGLVLADQNLMPELQQTPTAAYAASVRLIQEFHGKGRARYAVTPRFAIATSEAMLEVCATLLQEFPGVHYQSHLNENRREIAEVARLFPWASDYTAVYERYGLAGPRGVMAHNVHPSAGELERMAAAGTSVAHCPCSNAALGSGLFPLRRHVEAGVRCALGTDVGGGTGFGMLKEGLQAYLLQRVMADGFALTPAHLLFLATRAGAEALMLADEVGDFAPGKAADFVYLRPPDGSPLAAVVERAGSLDHLLAALFTLGGADCVREVRVAGEAVCPA